MVSAQPVTPDRAFEYSKNCVTIENALPAEARPGGELVLYDRAANRGMVYDFETQVDRRSPFPFRPYKYDKGLDFASSPDRKWMAYIDYSFDPGGHSINSRKLIIQNAEGRKIDTSYWITNWQWVMGWLDNTHLVLQTPLNSPESRVILNPFTGEWRVFKPRLPDFEKPKYWKAPLHLDYNTTLSHIMLTTTQKEASGKSRKGIALLDIQNNQVVWSQDNVNGYSTRWSPDGKRLGILKPNASGLYDFMLIGLNGKEDLVIANTVWDTWMFFSWAQDGERLAVWSSVENTENTSTPLSHLMLADLKQRTLTDLCITQDFVFHTLSENPVWSPDGRFLAVTLRYGDELFFKTILIDVEHQRAYQFRDNAITVDWMRKPK